eukprot:806447-Prymnesium_polylepis.1
MQCRRARSGSHEHAERPGPTLVVEAPPLAVGAPEPRLAHADVIAGLKDGQIRVPAARTAGAQLPQAHSGTFEAQPEATAVGHRRWPGWHDGARVWQRRIEGGEGGLDLERVLARGAGVRGRCRDDEGGGGRKHIHNLRQCLRGKKK